MNQQNVPAKSVWQDRVRIADRPKLMEDIHVDVCVVGAGIAGLSIAYQLAKEGRLVAVVEDGSIGGGMSGMTTAHLVTALDDRYFELERVHGLEGAQLAASSHAAAINSIERIANEENIDCDFCRLDGYLFTPPGDDSGEIEREYAAARRAGIADVAKVANAPIGGIKTGTALRFPQQAQMHPLKYLAGLAKAIERLGGRIYCNTHATTITGGSRAQVETQQGPVVSASSIVVATNVPVNNLLAIHTKQAPYTTYVIAVEVTPGAIIPALYWDTRQHAQPSTSGDVAYHFVRLKNGLTAGQSGVDLLIVGGEDHKSGQAQNGAERFDRLESWARAHWPQVGKVKYRWSGQVMEPNDGMAFIGRNAIDHSNVYVATGDSGNGMTHGAIAGILISDLIQDRPNPWQGLYDPGRVKLLAIPEFIRENANVTAQYAKGYLGPAELRTEADIAVAEGAIIHRGIQKIAVFRDAGGCLHERSAVCPHLGCVVAWNSVEKSWDCPCHGSRFSALGDVINGPANVGLATIDEH